MKIKAKCQLDCDRRPIPESACPTCKYKMDAATATVGYYRPRKGDLSVCFNCGEVLTFGDSMVLRLAELNDLLKVDEETRDWLHRVSTKIQRERPLSNKSLR